MPAHTHGFNTSTVPDHRHNYIDNWFECLSTTHWIGGLVPTPLVYDCDYEYNSNPSDPAGAHFHSGTTAGAGGNASFSILPPYFKLAYIMKL
jgi:microcystin-dependent protein